SLNRSQLRQAPSPPNSTGNSVFWRDQWRTTPMTNFYVISIDRATQEELNRAHQIIKENANGWWHRHATTWIAGGLTAAEWRDLLKDTLRSSQSSVLVLKLPKEEAGSAWAF